MSTEPMTTTKHSPTPGPLTKIENIVAMHAYECLRSDFDALKTQRDALLSRLVVARDWLADKGVPADHVEMVRIQAAIALAQPK